MEYILLFIDFLRTREKRIFLVNVIIPLIVSIIVFCIRIHAASIALLMLFRVIFFQSLAFY